MKRWHWAVIGIAVATAAAGLIYIAHRYGTRYCFALKAVNYAREAKDKVAPIDCLEFWLNRYQSVLAGFLAAGVALIVARPVFRQLREMNRQSAVAIRGVEEAYARELEAEYTKLSSYREIFNKLNDVVDAYDEAVIHAQEHGVTYNNNFVDHLRECGAYLRDISAMFVRYPDGSSLSTARKDFLRAANAYRSACDKALTAFRNETFGADVEEGEEEMNSAQVAAARAAIAPARTKALKEYGVLLGRLKSETRTQWARVRHLQRMARGEV